jgi:hypothetical protein
MTWSVAFHHDDHTHPFIAPETGATGGSFVIPVTGETDPDVFYRIHLKVTDSIGLVHETFRDVVPNLSEITLDSNVPGLEIALDGQPRATPQDITGVVNLSRTLEAPRVTSLGGQHYAFIRWTDGETDPFRTISFPGTPATFTAEYLPVEVDYLSDLPFATAPVNGWGPVERDRSNGETGPTDGKTITLQGKTYAKGLGVHSTSRVQFDLSGKNYSHFISDVGVDDEVGANGTVDFEVWLDGVRIYSSLRMTGTSFTQTIDVDVTGGRNLLLVVTNSGDGNAYDHADWAEARLILPPDVPGDADGDGDVDLVDFNTLKTHFAMSGVAREMGDFDENGTIDLVDFNILKEYFGVGAALAASIRGASESHENDFEKVVDLALGGWGAGGTQTKRKTS